ncbi:MULTISPECIES: hypothetical protein [Streptomyces]|uniref:hypothetical protein n=1 Tax=Streptomyces TaxID=1883 RepID=UPI001FD30410|nr:hypothetical protein [Streptomyces kasugaensis]
MQTPDSPDTPDTPGNPDSPDTPGSPTPTVRRRRTPLAVTSMAAAVLLAGGGAAYWAASAGGAAAPGTGAPAQGDPPPLALDGTAGGGSIAAGEPDPRGARYRAVVKLPGGPAAAPVYRPQGQIGQDAVERLAKALDVAGKVRSEGTVWRVGGPARDGHGPALQVNRTGSGAWTYTRYGAPGGTNCPLPASPKAGSGGSGAAGPASTPPGCPSYRADAGATASDEGGGGGGGAVPPEKAAQAVRPVLAALGQEDAKLDTGGLSGAVRTVTARPVLGGLPTYGWQSTLQVGSDGQVVGGSGQLAQLVKGADYPVLSADKTLALLNSPGGRPDPGNGCASPGNGTRPDKGAGTGTGGIAPCEPSPAKAPQPAEVTGAVFGLAMRYVDGGPALVPSWLFTVRQAGTTGDGPDASATLAHPAVQPKYLTRRGGDGAPHSPRPSGKAGVTALDSYAVAGDGKKLTLRFWGGVCSSYAASAVESATTVRVEVVGTEREPGQVCVKIAKEFTATVTLAKPLDGRKVVDVSSGGTVPKG